VKLAGTKQDPKIFQPSLGEITEEDVGVVPQCGDDNAGAESPRAFAAREHNDRDIDQGLKGMKQANARVKDRRQNEGENKEPGANQNGHADPTRRSSLL